MNREMELEHLAQAERHLEQGRANIAKMQRLITSAVGRGDDVKQAEASLASMRVAFGMWVGHREQILQALRDIGAGKYPRN